MTTFKHILVPTDFRGASNEALSVAISLAKKLDAKITLLHVWEIPIYPYMDFMLNTEVITSVEDAATKGLERAVAELKKELPTAEGKLRSGEAWYQIQEEIRELKPDLVVMGTHGRRGLSHLTLGSVAEKTVRSSTVPVLTVHERT
jgi:nucleotide-binding universal stress UspA family protein